MLPIWEQKSPFFARGLKLCKTLDLVEFVDDLAQVDARFHVVVVIGEDFAHEQGAFVAARKVDIGEGGEEFLIDKFDELITSNALVIARPLIPVQLGGDGRAVVVLQQLQLFIFIAEYFQKQHPPQLKIRNSSLPVPVSWRMVLRVDLMMEEMLVTLFNFTFFVSKFAISFKEVYQRISMFYIPIFYLINP